MESKLSRYTNENKQQTGTKEIGGGYFASCESASCESASCESASCESASCDRGFELYVIQKDEYGIKTM